MTDQELIKRVAVEIMGWFHPVSHDGQVYRNLWVSEQEADSSVNQVISVDTWNPLTNANHWMMVVESMRDKGWYLVLEYLTTGLIEVGFVYKKTLPNRPQKIIEYHYEPGHAVCLATLKTRRMEDE